MLKPMKEMTDQELLALQKTGIDADNFLRLNEFYTRHLKPELDHMRDQAKDDGEWNPNKTTDPAAALAYNAYNSGKRAGLNGIEAACKRNIAWGESASKELDRRAKVKKPESK